MTAAAVKTPPKPDTATWITLPQACRLASVGWFIGYRFCLSGEWEAVQGDNGRWLVNPASVRPSAVTRTVKQRRRSSSAA